MKPSGTALVGHADVRIPIERVFPTSDRTLLGVASELVVAVADQPKSVFVKTEPDVQAVLFDAIRKR